MWASKIIDRSVGVFEVWWDIVCLVGTCGFYRSKCIEYLYDLLIDRGGMLCVLCVWVGTDAFNRSKCIECLYDLLIVRSNHVCDSLKRSCHIRQRIIKILTPKARRIIDPCDDRFSNIDHCKPEQYL